MFAKQFTKILEGLGIKLDGDGKFTLNPLKKFEEEAIGGKRITGAARGFLSGTAGAFTGAGIGAGLVGAWRGAKGGKGWSETGKAMAAYNKNMRQAKQDGSTFLGRAGARIAAATGLRGASENIDSKVNNINNEVKERQDRVKNIELEREQRKNVEKEKVRKAQMQVKSMGDAKTTFIEKMKDGTGAVGKEYLAAKRESELIGDKLGQKLTWTDAKGTVHTDEVVTQKHIDDAKKYLFDLEQDGWKKLVDEQLASPGLDAKLQTKLDVVISDYATAHGVSEADARAAITSGAALNGFLGMAAGDVGRAEAAQRAIDEEYYSTIEAEKKKIDELEERARNLSEQQRRNKANENAINNK